MPKKKKSFATIYVLNGEGGAVKETPASLSDLMTDKNPVWVHLNLSDVRAARWLKRQKELSEWVRENLLNPEALEPRMRVKQNRLLLVLRTVDITPRSEPDDLVFLRLFATEKILISACLSPTIDFKDIDELFSDNDGPKNINDLIPVILENTLDSVTESIDRIEDLVDDMEENIITGHLKEGMYQSLSELLRQVIVIRRFMMPEREVLDNLIRHGIRWFNAETERSIRDDFDRVRRIVEDIDLLEKRIRVNQDALSHIEDKQTQKNMYMLSVIAGIFLPLSFIASVFGMNLGGIPLNEQPYGFLAINVGMLVIGLFIWFLFKKLKWV